MGERFPACRTIIIENIEPEIDAGRFPVKREAGDVMDVSADVYKDGHDLLVVELRWRKKGRRPWERVPMAHGGNDRWEASFALDELGRYEYTVHARVDVFGSWVHELREKHAAGQDVTVELIEGRRLVEAAIARADAATRPALQAVLEAWDRAPEINDRVLSALNPELRALMDRAPDESIANDYGRNLEVQVDRERARFAAWYEMFPRSQGADPSRGSTFREAEARLPDIAGMGFDVVYMPPIHPIGRTKRKGPNNTLVAGPNDPGSPYAIGNEQGGHKAVEPSLGTLDDFGHFAAACREHGMEVALDFAINCSPDHPYVKDHPEWFYHRPDGTIKYAENPPKKYEDIYPLNFHCEDWKNLWLEMRSIVEFWIGHGVKIFRVDNPHTKPVIFWEWLIGCIQREHPDVIFLSEAFTRPKMMRMLAKAGFTQSYTYFTWRNFKWELEEYFEELTQGPMREYFRGNLFANTPDILTPILQEGGRPAFRMRAVLACTLSPLYGIYSGFELCENEAIPGREEYLHSEKYQFKVRDWNAPGNIKDYIRRLNRIRRENPALHEYDNLRFHESENENILFYGKVTRNPDNIILVAVNLDPFQMHHSYIYVPLEDLGMGEEESYEVVDLITDQTYLWKGAKNYIELDPHREGAHIFRIQRWARTERDYDGP